MITERRTRIAGLLFAVAAAQFLLAEALTATRFDGYSYAFDTISALGMPSRSNWHMLMNVSFCVSAALVLIAGTMFARVVARRQRVYAAAVAAYCIGTVLVAVVHSGDGSAHVVGAVLAIGAGNAVALLVGTGGPGNPRWYSLCSVGLGVLGFLACAALVVGIGPIGAVERAAVYTFTAWEILTAVVVFSAHSRKDSDSPAHRLPRS